jgi:hypothetical protein
MGRRRRNPSTYSPTVISTRQGPRTSFPWCRRASSPLKNS